MSEYIHLIGAEDVSRAGRTIANAAHEMQNAMAAMEDSLHRHRIFLDDWLQRLEAVLKWEISKL